jgi:hypothetical protein
MTNIKTLGQMWKAGRVVWDRQEEELTLNTQDQVRLLITSLKFD